MPLTSPACAARAAAAPASTPTGGSRAARTCHVASTPSPPRVRTRTSSARACRLRRPTSRPGRSTTTTTPRRSLPRQGPMPPRLPSSPPPWPAAGLSSLRPAAVAAAAARSTSQSAAVPSVLFSPRSSRRRRQLQRLSEAAVAAVTLLQSPSSSALSPVGATFRTWVAVAVARWRASARASARRST
jgi:hypothetical protein